MLPPIHEEEEEEEGKKEVVVDDDDRTLSDVSSISVDISSPRPSPRDLVRGQYYAPTPPDNSLASNVGEGGGAEQIEMATQTTDTLKRTTTAAAEYVNIETPIFFMGNQDRRRETLETDDATFNTEAEVKAQQCTNHPVVLSKEELAVKHVVLITVLGFLITLVIVAIIVYNSP